MCPAHTYVVGQPGGTSSLADKHGFYKTTYMNVISRHGIAGTNVPRCRHALQLRSVNGYTKRRKESVHATHPSFWGSGNAHHSRMDSAEASRWIWHIELYPSITSDIDESIHIQKASTAASVLTMIMKFTRFQNAKIARRKRL